MRGRSGWLGEERASGAAVQFLAIVEAESEECVDALAVVTCRNQQWSSGLGLFVTVVERLTVILSVETKIYQSPSRQGGEG